MKSIQALRERRDALAKNLNNLLENHPGEKWTDVQQTAYDDGMREIDTISAEIQRHEGLMARLAADALNGDTDGLRNAVTRTPGAHSESTAGVRAYLMGGLNALSQEDLASLRERQTPDIRAAMSTTTGSEGGYTVATEYYRQLTEAMKLYGGIRQVARTIRTGTGAAMNFPAADATAEEGEIVGQNGPVNKADTSFENLSLEVYKYSSKSIAIPFELIQDGMFDIDAYIQALLAMRIGRITSRHFMVGSGNKQPMGLITAAQVGETLVAGASIDYDALIDLEHSVDPVYRARPNVGWMLNDKTLRDVRKIKDENKRPIFVPGYEQGNPGGAPDRLLNRPIHIVQEMPDVAPDALPIAFGDFGSYFIREVMDLTIFRMTDSAFTLNGQVGFVAFNRQGGNLIDVGGAVKTLKMGPVAG
ncbi:capsid protein [Pandoraea pnomenusa]|uniref:Predicted phage phi-C31 gp36 major capsid-like protein n=1 Tax=Pandoraea pnomenusa TaxID=93220 RepID=A0A378YUK8_9BURK|nr:phage major capsid protein [Pandoraea pnomenusa]AIU28375.1 capsid protein [Pandoraea pnomenusa]SUA80453.1 Predicted phage phi-C31 gp36 major capsid-like protein [Pandoraea pnomenusa]